MYCSVYLMVFGGHNSNVKSPELPRFVIIYIKMLVLFAPEQKDLIKSGYPDLMAPARHIGAAVDAIALALLSGILWQGSPPEEEVEEIQVRAQSFGRKTLDQSQDPLYHVKVEELAHRGVRLDAGC